MHPIDAISESPASLLITKDLPLWLSGLLTVDLAWGYTRDHSAMQQLPSGTAKVIRCGVFEIDLKAFEMRKHGLRMKLAEQPFRILEILLEQPGAGQPAMTSANAFGAATPSWILIMG